MYKGHSIITSIIFNTIDLYSIYRFELLFTQKIVLSEREFLKKRSYVIVKCGI